jgi:hypothetical protein
MPSIHPTSDSDRHESIINVSEYTIPEDVKTKWICYLKGDIKFNFNSEKGYFTEGEVKLNMAFQPEKTNDNDGLSMALDMETTINLKLVKVE